MSQKVKVQTQEDIIKTQSDIIQKLRNLNIKSINLSSKILYEWKISFYIGLLLNFLFFYLGFTIGVRL